ncbi:MAG: formylglycine-generating enzyme family protein [Nitrospirota bacterium]|nr:formylglycine-generating enzyme family protein [Nitrospirota bacterium]
MPGALPRSGMPFPAVALLAVLLAAIPWTAQADDGKMSSPHPGTPFTAVSAEACGACHGPDGSGPRVDMGRGDCAECHAGSHELPLLTVADTPGADRPGRGHGPNLARMALIPAGPVTVGNDGREITEGKGNLDETPEHVVDLPAFYIDLYEVTNLRYQGFVNVTGHVAPRHWKDGKIPPGKKPHPVVYVSWFDADEFCRWEGKRLPTELEWEKAARGTDGRIFPWGNHFELERANTPQRWAAHGEAGDTMPVGSFENGKSPFGLYDMSGNVWEWTADWYLPYPGNEFPDTHYGEINKVLRGGSWYDCLSYGCGLSAPTYNRSRFTPKIRNNSFGFRCAAEAPKNAPTTTPTTTPNSGAAPSGREKP